MFNLKTGDLLSKNDENWIVLTQSDEFPQNRDKRVFLRGKTKSGVEVACAIYKHKFTKKNGWLRGNIAWK